MRSINCCILLSAFVGSNIEYKKTHGVSNIKCSILIYVQQDETLHSLFYLETALHISGGTITHHQERK